MVNTSNRQTEIFNPQQASFITFKYIVKVTATIKSIIWEQGKPRSFEHPLPSTPTTRMEVLGQKKDIRDDTIEWLAKVGECQPKTFTLDCVLVQVKV